jgi:hypothetical protein
MIDEPKPTMPPIVPAARPRARIASQIMWCPVRA